MVEMRNMGEPTVVIGVRDIFNLLFPILYYKKLREEAQAPQVAHLAEDTGYDLFACEDVAIFPHTTKPVPTGISIEFRPRCGGRIGTRSSLARQGIIAVGGEIDAGYRGEVLVMLHNLWNMTYAVQKGDKIAQLIAVPEVVVHLPVETQELSPSQRGSEGFGSTGK